MNQSRGPGTASEHPFGYPSARCRGTNTDDEINVLEFRTFHAPQIADAAGFESS